MLTIEKTVTMSPEQWEMVIDGTRNPKNSWAKSDSSVFVRSNCGDEDGCSGMFGFELGECDEALMMGLAEAGPSHSKYRRMMPVWVDVKAPLYWWKEYDTYKVGTVANSCSTMHKIHSRDLDLPDFSWEHLCPQDIALLEGTIGVINYHRKKYLKFKEEGNAAAAKEEWYSMIQLLGTNYEQKRTLFLNYEVLANIYDTRANHKLDEWHTFCAWIETLPYSELITGRKTENAEGCDDKREEKNNEG
jgi:hypothetical protein